MHDLAYLNFCLVLLLSGHHRPWLVSSMLSLLPKLVPQCLTITNLDLCPRPCFCSCPLIWYLAEQQPPTWACVLALFLSFALVPWCFCIWFLPSGVQSSCPCTRQLHISSTACNTGIHDTLCPYFACLQFQGCWTRGEKKPSLIQYLVSTRYVTLIWILSHYLTIVFSSMWNPWISMH